MNAKHAVLKAYALYAWIEQNPFKYKPNYPVKELCSPSRYFCCPLCEYAGFSRKANFDNCIYHCPMYNHWPMENRSDHCGTCYFNSDSCYNIWDDIVSDYSFHDPAVMGEIPRGVYDRAMRNAGDVAAALWKRYKQLELEELRKS